LRIFSYEDGEEGTYVLKLIINSFDQELIVDGDIQYNVRETKTNITLPRSRSLPSTTFLPLPLFPLPLFTDSLAPIQKVTAFSRSPNPLTPPLLAIGSTSSQLSLVSLPNLNNVLSEELKGYEGEEIFDVDFNDDGEMVRAPHFASTSRNIGADWKRGKE